MVGCLTSLWAPSCRPRRPGGPSRGRCRRPRWPHQAGPHPRRPRAPGPRGRMQRGKRRRERAAWLCAAPPALPRCALYVSWHATICSPSGCYRQQTLPPLGPLPSFFLGCATSALVKTLIISLGAPITGPFVRQARNTVKHTWLAGDSCCNALASSKQSVLGAFQSIYSSAWAAEVLP